MAAAALAAECTHMARFLAGCLDMLANYHQSQTPLVSIIARGTVIGRDRTGVIIVPAEVDYVSWTKRASGLSNSREALYSSKRPSVAAVWVRANSALSSASSNFL